ncbi:hypothetical protein MKEN_00198600 [Mycena kentingensis (nom. inval.)]|nr:hypothetical protein MKEN_00198600 [Mycena kentingensis (nom. inval.)]
MGTNHEPRNVDELWFSDGNIIIQAENLRFRVFKGILAARSPVFSDMMSLPAPAEPDAQDSEDGCPLVRMHDSGDEATRFLKAIFDSDFFPPFPLKCDGDTVFACLRLANKYQVDYLRHRALAHLSSAFPMSLDVLDMRYEHDSLAITEACSWAMELGLSEVLRVIAIAREVEAPWVLPLAFYYLSWLLSHPAQLFQTLSIPNEPGNSALSAADREVFLQGYDHQSHVEARLLPPTLEGKFKDCHSPHDCLAARLDCLDLYQHLMYDREETPPPLHIMRMADEPKFKQLCDVCYADLESEYLRRRNRVWQALPGWYSLPDWDVLERMKKEAIPDA